MRVEWETLLPWAAEVLTGLNLLEFTLMGLDKRRARRGGWRIRERTLLLAALLGGALGGWVGMRVFHHKTRHWYFRWGLPGMLLLHLGLAGVLWRYLG